MPLSSNTSSFFKKSEGNGLSFLKNNELYISAAIFITSLFYYLSYASYGFSETDWGLIAITAERFLQGKVFYRDFSSAYTPGIYLYTALAFKLFGSSMHSAAVAWSILRAFNCLLIYRIGIRFAPRGLALILPLILLFAPGALHKSFFIFFILSSLLILLSLMSTDRKGFYFFSGIAAGITLIFRIDLFVFFVITALLVEFLKSVKHDRKITVSPQIARSLKNLAFFSGGIVIAVLPLVLYLALNSAIKDAISQTYGLVSSVKQRVFLLPPVTQIFSWKLETFTSYAILFIPFVIYSLLLIALISDIRNKKFNEKDKKLLILFVYGGMTLNQILTSPDLNRFFQVTPGILIADVYLISRHFINHKDGYRKKLRWIYPAVLTTVNFVIISLIIASCFMSGIYWNGSIFIQYKNTVFVPDSRIMQYMRKEQAEEFNRIVNITETLTGKDDPIFTIPHLGIYYFATGRKSATRYDLLMDIYGKSDEKQLEIIRNLEDKKVKLIIFRDRKVDLHYPLTIILNYINKRYRIKERVGDKLIFVRKTAA